jgi:predicted patatin/cPLA2 family phospholipase
MWDKVGMAHVLRLNKQCEIAALMKSFTKMLKYLEQIKSSIRMKKSDSAISELGELFIKMLHRNKSWRSLQRSIKLKMVKQNVMTKISTLPLGIQRKPSDAVSIKTWYLMPLNLFQRNYK